MEVVYLTLLFILWGAMPFLLATRPRLSRSTTFDIERRAKNGDEKARNDLLRLKSAEAVTSIARLKILIVQIVLTCLGLAVFGWGLGIAVTLILTVLSNFIANFGFIKSIADKIYGIVEKSLLNFIDTHPRLVKIFYINNTAFKSYSLQIKSRAELLHLIEKSDGALSFDEKQMIANSLSFKDRDIKSIMTQRNSIKTVDRAEFLGPLVLNELHKSGHSYLPVINGDLDHIVGILNISSLLSLDNKKSTTAEKVMDRNVYRIKETSFLPQALEVFLQTQNRLLVVVNEAKETTGIVVLKDLIEALVGQQGQSVKKNNL